MAAPSTTSLEAGHPLRECDDCGLVVRLGPVSPGVDSRCPRCDAVLRRHRESEFHAPMALAVASLVLCLLTVSSPFLGLRLLGQDRDSEVFSGAWVFYDDGLWILSILVIATVVLVPLLRLGLRLMVLGGLRMDRPPPILATMLRWHEKLGIWTMLEVFLFGALVSYTRLADLAEVEFGPAVYGLAAAVVAMVAADGSFEPQAAWDALERRAATAHATSPPPAGPANSPQPAGPTNSLQPAGPAKVTQPARAGAMRIACDCCHKVSLAVPGDACPRCDSTLRHRKPNSITRSWALLIAAAVLYIPANYYPVMTVVTLGQGGPHTILGGVMEFAESGFLPLALIVFLASVAVPMLKLLGLAWMLIATQQGSARALLFRTRLYRFVEAIGRWSMIDVFVVSVLIALVRFGPIASINADIGAACFGAVVVLTMIAAETFDPRLMWDVAEEDTAVTPAVNNDRSAPIAASAHESPAAR
ncbi:paraquat-inducible protein A [Acetobacteraceae bacterium H6797]|nr:paraquat-inducible protein A [Acetobacteraceae bacterium H6797]